MSRYVGSINKKSRRYQHSLLETNKEFMKGKKRITIPGQHGSSRQKLSNYGEHLYEKQKLAYTYGLTERQLKNLFKKSTKIKTNILGHNLIFLLESRLDNLVYRMGIASTRRQARQFVTHGHILVNDKKVDIPSYVCKVDDEVFIKKDLQNNDFVKTNLTTTAGKTKLFVSFDSNSFKGKYLRTPNRDEVALNIKDELIVEFYNR